jgi:maltose alpha-D-glucosyltransferase/alpha-amylase
MVLPLYLDGHFRLRLGGSGNVRVRIIDCMLWADSLLTLIEVEHKDGSRARLLLPLVLVWQANDVELALAPPASSVLARVRRRAMPGLLNDAFASEAFVHTLIAAIGEAETIPLERGRLRLQPTAAFARLAAAQSQSSFRVTVMAPGIGAVLDERLVLKPVLSRGREGDARFADAVEQLEYLTEAGGFGHMPSLAARIWYQVEADAPSQRSLVGLLLEYLPNQGNLRELTQALVQRLCDAYGERVDAWLIDPAQISIETLYRALGARIAEMHRILSNAPVDGAFAPVALSEQALAEHLRQMALAVQATLSALDAHLNQLAAALRSSAANLMEQRHRLDGFLFGPLPGAACPLRISIHGDLRLERVLVTENDVALLEADSGAGSGRRGGGFCRGRSQTAGPGR